MVNQTEEVCPFIFVSGFAESIDIGRDYTLISKPVDPDQLVAEVTRVLDRESKQQHRGTIVVFDQDVDGRDGLCRVIRHMGFKVYCYKTPDDVFNFLEHKNEQVLVLASLEHDHTAGLKLLRDIRASEYRSRATVLMVCNVDNVNVAEEALRLGALDFIYRPFNKVTLEFRLQQVFRAFGQSDGTGLNSSDFTILVVDDDESVRMMLADFYECQYNVVVADGYDDALEKVAEYSPDIAIVDQVLPERSGLSLVKAINMFYPEVLFIMLTGSGSRTDPIEAIRLGIFDYLEKPVRYQVISRVIARATETIKLRRFREQADKEYLEDHRKTAVRLATATIADELSSPVSLLEIGVNNIRRCLDSRGTEDFNKISEIMDVLEKSLHKTRAIVQSLKVAGRFQTDEVEACTIEELILESVDLCRGEFKKWRVEPEITHDQKDALLSCYRTEFVQMLVQLFINACQAMEDSDRAKLVIETRTVTNHVEIKVEDYGVGIPQVMRNRIFDPFYTSKSRNQNTGLGLTNCKRIVNAHFGELSFECRSDGTTFVIKVPRGLPQSRAG